MSEREFEFGHKELLDVRPADVCGLLNLHNTENLQVEAQLKSCTL